MIGYKRLQRVCPMTNPPKNARTRRTAGGRALADFVDRHGLRAVSVYIPGDLHRALATTAIENETNLQSLVTLSCNNFYGQEDIELPPLTAPTRPKQDPHKNFTWYADVDLHKKMKMLAVMKGSTVQQLVLSAVVNYMKDAPRVRALGIETGFPAYARAPDELPVLAT